MPEVRVEECSFGIILEDGRELLSGGSEGGDVQSFVAEGIRVTREIKEVEGGKLVRVNVESLSDRRVGLRDIVLVKCNPPRRYLLLKTGFQTRSLTRVIGCWEKDPPPDFFWPLAREVLRRLHSHGSAPAKGHVSYYVTAIMGEEVKAVLGFLTAKRFLPYFVLSPSTIAAYNHVGIPVKRARSEELLIVEGDWLDGLERYAEEIKLRGGGGRGYGYTTLQCLRKRVSLDAVERILKNIKKLGIPAQFFVLGDGYQRADGDWLQASRRFPGGVGRVSEVIRQAGLEPAIWISPFWAREDSVLLKEHPDWVLRDGNGEPVVALIEPFQVTMRYYALDVSREDVQEHILSVLRELHRMGFTTFFIDGLHVGVFPELANGDRTSIEVYRDILKKIRTELEGARIIAMRAPTLPTIDLVDGIELGMENNPNWQGNTFFKLLRKRYNFWAYPNMRDSLVGAIHRWYLKGVTGTAPGPMIVRKNFVERVKEYVVKKEIREPLLELQATVYFLVGSYIIFSDPPEAIEEERMRAYLATVPPSELVGRPLDYWKEEPTYLLAEGADFRILAIINWEERERDVRVDLAELGLEEDVAWEFWTSKIIALGSRKVELTIPSRGARVLVLRRLEEFRNRGFLLLGTNLHLGQKVEVAPSRDGLMIAANLPGKRRGDIYFLSARKMRLADSDADAVLTSLGPLHRLSVEFTDSFRVRLSPIS